MLNINENGRGGQAEIVISRKITKAKHIIARMESTGELEALGEYIRERVHIIYKRKHEQKIQDQWEKIANLPIGSQVAVNANGYREMPRGTVLEIDSFSARGRKCVYLKIEGKRYSFNKSHVYNYDIMPAAEVDLTKPFERGLVRW